MEAAFWSLPIVFWSKSFTFLRILILLPNERIDEFNNRTDYDHRNIKFKRYKTRLLDGTAPGRILSMTDGLVIGTNSNFLNDFNIGSVVFIEYTEPEFYKVIDIFQILKDKNSEKIL